jgi:UDP-GlcNAc:undecaprenyl-phosphate GlcNAc-1-phosphate transferase
MEMPQYAMHLLNALLIVVVLIPPFQFIAQRIGLMDMPHGRKTHDGAVPLTGGLVMFIAFSVPMLTLDFPQTGLFLAGLCLLVGVGVVDDLYDLGPWIKLSAQVFAALVMVMPGPTVVGPEALLGHASPGAGLMDVAFTVFLIVGLTNAFNMIDGIDGLAGGAAAVSLMGLAIVAGISGQRESEMAILLLLFAVLGFLIFNMRHRWRRRAAVFMGDAGSLMLGAAISFFIVKLSAGGPASTPPLPILLWLIAIPAFDTTILIARRLMSGRSPLVGDRAHLHHLLLQAGEPPQSATVILVTATSILCAVGILGWQVGLSPMVMLLGLAVPFAFHLYFVCHGWKRLAHARAERSGRIIAKPLGPVGDQAA